MIKLQQFDVYSLKYSDLKERGFDFNMGIQEARELGFLISLGDSEVLRAIRRLTDHPYDESFLAQLESERKMILRSSNNMGNRESIMVLNQKIEKQLFIPEFVSVIFPNTRDYDKLNERGFKINGIEFTWLMCGAGHQRTNRAMYVDKKIYDRLDTVLRNGANVGEMVLAKYNAYYALSSSSTYRVRKPRVCVIPDCEIKMKKLVDFCSNGKITREERELNFNVFDGQGLISPTFSKLWANDLGIYDYVPSAWGVRCAFIKGMCVTFDFHKFAEEILDGEKLVKDVWGRTVDISDVDLILSQSQFKLWNAYENWEEYESNLWVNSLSWGVSKVSPKIEDEKTMMMTNYQFLQVLNLTDEDIVGLCSQTSDWLKGVACGDLQKTKLYLLGNIANKKDARKAFDSVQDSFVKCLLMEKELMKDEYIRFRIVKSINKRIKESYFGNLIINGNFMARISDPYAQCEFMFGLEPKGLLKDKQHYVYYWNQRGAKEVVAMRSPLTYKTEAHKLHLQDNALCSRWYEYLTSGVVYNIWGVDCLLEAGADYDFDIVATTDNKYFLKGILDTDIPVTYEARKPKKEKITREGLMKIAGVGFSPEIGLLTNHSTTFHDMQSKYERGTKEWEALETRLKVCCELQSMQIDKAKGLEIDEIPKWWTQYKLAKERDNGEEGINCKLLIETRPYFMRYRYENYNKEYKDYLADRKRYCITVFGNTNGVGYEETPEYKELQRYCSVRCSLSDNKGLVNRICHHMEKDLVEIKSKKEKEDFNLYDILWGESEIDPYILQDMENVRKEYLKFKQSTKLVQTEFVTWEQYFKSIRIDCLQNISNNLIELAKYATFLCYKKYANKGKDFVWDCFGAGITQQMKNKHSIANIPILDDMGDIEYLGKKYWDAVVPVNGEIQNENAVDIEDIINYDLDNDFGLFKHVDSLDGEDWE